jgi:hypothetical protein
MVKQIRNTKVGDVFCAKIDDNHKKYLQYIVSDLTQLNSDVIRAFKKSYSINANPNLFEIVSGEVDFYAHCATKIGVKRGLWEKIGNIQDIGCIETIVFKSKKDYTKLEIQNDWKVWKINGEFMYVGELKDKYKKAHLGLVFQPERIIDKLKTGSYTAYYEFE